MSDKLKYYQVNWIDGMKINKDHLIETDKAMIYHHHMLGKALINPYNYGILPGTENDPSLDISFEINSSNQIIIKVQRCRAITSGGYIIDIGSAESELSVFTVNVSKDELPADENYSGQFYIVLKIDPYNHIPLGEADPKENPPRHPYIIPEYEVAIIPVEQMNQLGFGDYYQVIGKIIMKENIPSLDETYIPPCSRVSSDEKLLVINHKLIGFFSLLETNIINIIKKIQSKQQQSPLAKSVLHFSDKIAAFQILHTTKQKLFLKHLPPVSLFEAISQFARLLKTMINTQPTDRKEEMINYFADWSNLKQGEIEELIIDTVNFEYNHFEIAAVMGNQMKFIGVMAVLFDTLSGLEYIGKRRDTQIYIKEEEKPKRSFLADD